MPRWTMESSARYRFLPTKTEHPKKWMTVSVFYKTAEEALRIYRTLSKLSGVNAKLGVDDNRLQYRGTQASLNKLLETYSLPTLSIDDYIVPSNKGAIEEVCSEEMGNVDSEMAFRV